MIHHDQSFSKSSFFGSVGSCWVGSVWLERIPKSLVTVTFSAGSEHPCPAWSFSVRPLPRRSNVTAVLLTSHFSVHQGYFSNFGNVGFIWSHGCASDVHTSTCGLNQLGSSKLAVLIATNWGTESGLTTIGEPQSGQKPRRVSPRISLGEAWKRSEPCKSLKASVATMTKDENGPPLDCWQSRQ